MQAIGYYITFNITGDKCPTTVLVIAEISINIISFPYYTNEVANFNYEQTFCCVKMPDSNKNCTCGFNFIQL